MLISRSAQLTALCRDHAESQDITRTSSNNSTFSIGTGYTRFACVLFEAYEMCERIVRDLLDIDTFNQSLQDAVPRIARSVLSNDVNFFRERYHATTDISDKTHAKTRSVAPP